MNPVFQSLSYYYNKPNYALYFLCLMALIVLPSLSILWHGGNALLQIVYTLVIFMSVLFTSQNRLDLIVLGTLGLILVLIFFFYQEENSLLLLNPILTSLFFSLVLWRIISFVLQDRHLDTNDIFALSSGYLLLPIAATPFFYFLHFSLPGSMGSGEHDYIDLMYFSFMTSTSVGYGDISPVHPIARSCASVLAVTGQLYLSILAGLILGKIVSRSKKPPLDLH